MKFDRYINPDVSKIPHAPAALVIRSGILRRRMRQKPCFFSII
jgi:hypothetical protein